jgi:hypothetical protein
MIRISKKNRLLKAFIVCLWKCYFARIGLTHNCIVRDIKQLFECLANSSIIDMQSNFMPLEVIADSWVYIMSIMTFSFSNCNISLYWFRFVSLISEFLIHFISFWFKREIMKMMFFMCVSNLYVFADQFPYNAKSRCRFTKNVSIESNLMSGNIVRAHIQLYLIIHLVFNYDSFENNFNIFSIFKSKSIANIE